MSSIKNFSLDLSDLGFTGHDLARPECVVAERDGTLWASDNRGIATRIDPDGEQTLLGPPVDEPNGMAMDRNGDLIVAAMSGGKVVKLSRSGESKVLLDTIEGKPVGACNFCFCDGEGRLWISVSTRRLPWWDAVAGSIEDGCVILIDDKGPRIVADGIAMTNEVRLDAKGQFLYAVETLNGRLIRFPVRPDGSLGDREVFGPDRRLPGGFIDGFTFDAEGNIWAVTVGRNGLIVITPDGSAHTVFEDPVPDALARVDERIAAGTATPADLGALAGKTLQLPTSLTFGGPDLKTCYMGSLAMSRLVTFRSPVAGLPMSHWSR